MAYVTCGSAGECTHPAQGRPLCHKHKVRERRATLGNPATLERRFWSKVDRSGGDDACWLWTANADAKGYGQFETNKAHRVAYQLLVGPIPDGLQLDHLCRVTSCVNPTHLEPVTNAENMRRSALARTHCKHGHEFTPENTYYSPGTGVTRHCRACARAKGTESYRRRHAPHLIGQPLLKERTHCKNGHELTPENTRLYQWPKSKKGPQRVCITCNKERCAAWYAAKKQAG